MTSSREAPGTAGVPPTCISKIGDGLSGCSRTRPPEVALKLGEYRKLSPGPIEEWIFFDHPSGRNRILMAMKWKTEHQGELGTVRRGS